VKEVKIYSATGSLVNAGKVENNLVDISKLLSGVYIFQTVNSDGSVLKSKFIKK